MSMNSELKPVDSKDAKRQAEQQMVRRLVAFTLELLEREGLELPDRIKIELEYPDEECAVEAYAPGVEPSEEWKDQPGEAYLMVEPDMDNPQ